MAGIPIRQEKNLLQIRPRSPSSLVLKENEVHIWLVQTNDESISLAVFEDLLSSAERDRAARFKFKTDQRRYLVSHAGLRSILSAYLKISPQELVFSAGAGGKPKLTPSIPGQANVLFNLSHSGEVALIAVTRVGEIGVDVEHIKKDFPIHEVAERFFTPKEVTALKTLPEPLQREAFFKCWTSKEAFLKAKGTGLSGKLDEVEVTLAAGKHVRINANVPGWSLTELNACDGYAAALVSEGDPAPVHLYRWSPSLI